MPGNDRPLPISGQDVKQVQDVGIMDKFGMVRQGLDPSNSDHVQKYMLAKNQGMAEGGQVKTPAEIAQDSMRKAFHFAEGGMVPPQQQMPAQMPQQMAPQQPMGPAPLQQPAPLTQNPQAMQLAALQKLRGF